MENQETEKNEIVTGIFRRKHAQTFWGLVGIFFIGLERLLSPFYSKFLDELKTAPIEARRIKMQVAVLVIVGGFLILNSAVAISFAAIGFKTKKAEVFPYPSKFCLFDTTKLQGEAATRKGNQFIRAGVIYFLATLVIIYTLTVVFDFSLIFSR